MPFRAPCQAPFRETMRGCERTTVLVLQLLMDVRTCLFIRGIPDFSMPAFWKVAWRTTPREELMQFQDTHRVVPIPAYGTGGQVITPAAYHPDEREEALDGGTQCMQYPPLPRGYFAPSVCTVDRSSKYGLSTGPRCVNTGSDFGYTLIAPIRPHPRK